MNSIDVYAKSNPALCSVIVWNFLSSYHNVNQKGCDMPLVYIVLPIILSKKLKNSFDRTNTQTGFFRWMNNNPAIINQLHDRLLGVEGITRSTLRFSIAADILKIEPTGHLIAIKDGFRKSPKVDKSVEEVHQMLTNANKLGCWCGQVDDFKDILMSLRLIK